MDCPQCGAPTEVSEKRGPFRDRRCTSAVCRLEFTTREHIMQPRKQVVKPRQHGRLCARTRATQIDVPPGFSAVRVKGTAASGLSAPSEPVTSATRKREAPPCLEAEVEA